MTRKTVLSIIAAVLFPMAALYAADDNTDAKVAESIKQLVDPNVSYIAPNGKKAAITFLAQNPGAAAIPLVDKLEASKDPQERLWVLLALAEFKDLSLLEPIADKFAALVDDGNFGVQYWGIKLVGRLKAKDAVKPLIALTESKDYITRREAALALGQIKDPAANQAVLKLLKDAEPTVRAAAADAIAALEIAGAKAQVIQALQAKDEKVFVMKSLVAAAEKVTGEPFGITANEWTGHPSVWQKKVDAWIKKNK